MCARVSESHSALSRPGSVHPAPGSCSDFVTEITFFICSRNLMEDSLQKRGTSGSEGLPALWRLRISGQARRPRWKGRGRRFYPDEVSSMRRHWKEKLHATFDRGLTARPVVLAKTYSPGDVICLEPFPRAARSPIPVYNPLSFRTGPKAR